MPDAASSELLTHGEVSADTLMNHYGVGKATQTVEQSEDFLEVIKLLLRISHYSSK